MSGKRVVVTGMSVNTPLGDTLDAFYAGLLAGKSAVSRWKCFARRAGVQQDRRRSVGL